MAWTDEKKEQAIKMYKEANPTSSNSTEIIKEISEDIGETANGVRMILVNAGVYVKKESNTVSTKSSSTGTRVSKDTQISSLKEILSDNGVEVDEEILSKLTGKAAAYFVSAFKQVTNDE
jgi:hypothetical protein